MALEALSPEQRKHLILSVGTHRGSRPLSPVEVAELVAVALRSGDSMAACAEALQLQSATQLSRFVALRKLPADLHHLVDWGSGAGYISFSAAFELSRLTNSEDQRAAVQAVLENGLASAEARQLAQLRLRSGRAIADCVASVLKMRPRIDVRHVVIGAIRPGAHQERLRHQSQAQRDQALAAVLSGPLKTLGAKGRLGVDRFTLVGGVEFGTQLSARGTAALEADVNRLLEEGSSA